MSVQVKMLMGEAPDIATAITTVQRLALEYMASKRLTGDQIISINQHTSEQRGTSDTPTHICFITIWFDTERVR